MQSNEWEDACNRRPLVADIVEQWRKHAAGRSTVVFAAGVKHSRAICAQLNEAGIVAEHLDGTTPIEEREAMLARLRAGATAAICNFGVLTEGWDFPELGCLVVARPTRSRLLHTQIVGRLMRNVKGKARPILLDHAGNCLRFGLPEWEHDPARVGMEGAGGGSEGVKRCAGGCDTLLPRLVRVCHVCGHEHWPIGEAPPQEAGDLVELSKLQRECAGASGAPCPGRKTPPRVAFAPSAVARRKGEPWRCQACGKAHAAGSTPVPAELKHQRECAGASGVPCPDRTPPSRWAFVPNVVARRKGEPWRCQACGKAHAAGSTPVPAELKHQRECAGAGGARCPGRKVPGRWVFAPVRVAERKGQPWRCKVCTYAHRRVHQEYQECAGSGSGGAPCPDRKTPPRGAFTPAAVARRKGEPWRCQACATRRRLAAR